MLTAVILSSNFWKAFSTNYIQEGRKIVDLESKKSALQKKVPIGIRGEKLYDISAETKIFYYLAPPDIDER